MNNPEYVKVDGELYKINTDFRVAIECDKIARDENIGDFERATAIIYKLFGERGVACENQQKLIELAIKYLSLGRDEKGLKIDSEGKFELDFEKIQGLIRSSFKFDYKYDPYELEYLHYYNFNNDLENLSTSEFGNCCALNKVIGILNEDASKIKDTKQRTKLVELQKYLKEKYCYVKEKKMTKEQEESAIEFYKSLGIDL